MDGSGCLRELNQRYGRHQIPVMVLTARDRMKELFELEGMRR
jgi:CheY-like chemotaxis protein